MRSTTRENMKSSRILIAAAALLLSLATALSASACSSQQASTAPSATQTTTGAAQTTAGTEPALSGYSFIFRGVEIVINQPAEPILQALGSPIHYFESPSCAFQGLDKIYTYAGIEIQTYTENEIDYIFIISVIDDTVSTPEGIRLGVAPDQVKSAYGSDYTESPNQLLYLRGDTQLKFIFADNELVSIEYSLPIAQ